MKVLCWELENSFVSLNFLVGRFDKRDLEERMGESEWTQKRGSDTQAKLRSSLMNFYFLIFTKTKAEIIDCDPIYVFTTLSSYAPKFWDSEKISRNKYDYLSFCEIKNIKFFYLNLMGFLTTNKEFTLVIF